MMSVCSRITARTFCLVRCYSTPSNPYGVKNIWNEELITQLKERFPDIKIYERERSGIVHCLLSEGKNHIHFLGETPVNAVLDLREGAELFQNKALIEKVEAIYAFIMEEVQNRE